MALPATPVSLLKQSLLIRWPWRALVLFIAFAAAIAGLASPLFQKLFIDRLLGDEGLAQGWQSLSWVHDVSPLFLITLAFVFTLFAQTSGLLATYIAVKEGLVLQRRFSDSLYRKMLAIRADLLGSTTIGEVVSIYATDIPGGTALIDQVMPMLAGIIFPLVFAPLAIRAICGIPLTSTIAVIGAILCVNFVMSARQSRFFYRFKQLAAERTGIVNEWIQNIRLLRILGWTEDFEKQIFAKRIEETENRIAMVTNGQLMNAFGSSINFVINLVGVATLVYMRSGKVTAGELFALLWIFGVFLQRPFRQIPWSFTFTIDSLSSLRRVERFMNRPSDPVISASLSDANETRDDEALAIEVRGLSLEVGGRRLLKDIDLDIKCSEFLAIVGEVGSGKSLLVLSLAGETGATFKSFFFITKSGRRIDALSLSLDERRRMFAYVGQEGFVMSATLRENVMFRYAEAAATATPTDNADVYEALKLAQFRVEGEHLANGLETEIGERGVNLSGGQRQRVALARAHFLRRPVLLLDDCLSAVDVDTERKLIRDLISGNWLERTRLLITHRLSVLEKVDRVIFIEDGRVHASGPFAELVKSSAKVREFVASVRRGDAKAAVVGGPTDDVAIAVEAAEATEALNQEAPDGQS